MLHQNGQAQFQNSAEINCCSRGPPEHEIDPLSSNSTECMWCSSDNNMHEDLLSYIIPAVLLLIIAALVIIILACWYYRSNRRKREIVVITEKGELIVLKHDRKHAKTQGQLVVRVSQLETMHSEHNYSDSNHGSVDLETHKQSSLLKETREQSFTSTVRGSIPLTEDGYATLEPESDMHSNTAFTTTSQKDLKDYPIENPGCKQSESQDCKIKVGDHYEVNESTEDEHDYEEPYWEPANKEEELLDQVSKLGVAMIIEKSIELREPLESGQFGVVQHGIWRGNSETGYKGIDVAVKTVENGGKLEERVKLLQEAVIMGQFKHPYILQILGVISGEENVMIVTEIMSKGDLHHHLLSLRQQGGQHERKELGAILLSYTRQIALGMGYLSLKQYVHRDLAARNILVSENGICKIADFGLSRDLQHGNYYISKGGKIPVKWTAPEALHYHKYSTASDVWSYGCLLYEIWSLGYKPFHDTPNAEAIQMISTGYRLPPPPGCPRTIYQIMITCWHPDPSSRQHTCDITVALQQPDFKILSWNEQYTSVSEKATVLGAPLGEGQDLFKDLQNTYTHEVTH